MDESWLLPYADLLTLLLAVFIILFASSSLDEGKFSKLSSVFSEIFEGGTWCDGTMRLLHTEPVPKELVGEETENSSYLEDQKSLGEIQERVDEYIAVNEFENQFETKLTDEGLLVTIRDSILFSTGSAEIAPEYNRIAEDIAELLVFDPPRQIIVTGHTDNIPIRNETVRIQLGSKCDARCEFLEKYRQKRGNQSSIIQCKRVWRVPANRIE